MGKDAAVPQWITNLVYVTMKLGFPTIAFGLMWWTCEHSIAGMMQQTQALITMIESLKSETQKEHKAIEEKINKLVDHQQGSIWRDERQIGGLRQ